MNFGKNLTVFRKQKNLSQEELAFIVGVSRQTIYTWEADIAGPNVVMLKRLSNALDVSLDELVKGPSIEALPNKMKNYTLKYISEYKPVSISGILDWFVKLEIGYEICFGLYDDGVKDYSYHLTVLGEVIIHDKEGYEILVEEYNKDMIKTKTFSLIARNENNEMQFLGRIDNDTGVKKIQTFKDDDFVNKWGGVTNTHFEKTKSFLLKYGDIEYKVIEISYLVDDNIYIECYLDHNLEPLLQRRFDKNRKSFETRMVNGNIYGYFYDTITDRLK